MNLIILNIVIFSHIFVSIFHGKTENVNPAVDFFILHYFLSLLGTLSLEAIYLKKLALCSAVVYTIHN